MEYYHSQETYDPIQDGIQVGQSYRRLIAVVTFDLCTPFLITEVVLAGHSLCFILLHPLCPAKAV